MSDYDFTALDRHRAKDHESRIRADSTSWARTDASRWLRLVLDRSEAELRNGEYTLSRERFGTLLTNGDLRPDQQIVLAYAWGGPTHGNNHVAGHAQRTSESIRDDTFSGDVREFLCNPRQRRVHDRQRADDCETLDHLVDPYHAFDKLWVPRDRTKGALGGMGTAYGTKVLYWAARAHGNLSWDVAPLSPIPLVYDMHVHRAVSALGVTWAVEGANPECFDDPSGKVRYWSYQAYCAWAYGVAQHLTASRADGGGVFLPDDVEYWLFLLSNSAGDHTLHTATDVSITAGGPDPEDQSRPDDQGGDTVDLDLVRQTMQEATARLGGPIRVRAADIDGPEIR